MPFTLCVALIFVSSLLHAADVDRVGTIENPEIKECSGIVASRQYPGVLWTHNDGKKEHLYAIDRKGSSIAEFKVTGAKFEDWEDIALDAANNLYAADTGNNNLKRNQAVVYQFAEPDPKSGQKHVAIKRHWTLRYPLVPFDCESLVIFGTNGFLISKVTRNRLAEVYSFPLQDSSEPVALKSVTRLLIDSPVTAAAVSLEGKRLAAISKEGAFFFEFSGSFPQGGIMRPINQIPYHHEGIEGCTFVPEGLLVSAESRELFLFKLPPR